MTTNPVRKRRHTRRSNEENLPAGNGAGDIVDIVDDAEMPDLDSDDNDDDEAPGTLAALSHFNDAIAGKVVEIRLENFMCHSNLRLRFDTDKHNCFYIVGANGSGKSAIFAGLNIGLGGKGRSNDRGNSISAYIKEGQSTARIHVHISNVGGNKHPDYDEEIIVERVIRGSSSTYSLKSKDEKGRTRVVSTAKKDLDNLLKRFCIELENPLCWLSQDRARQFLQDMHADKLYEIFMITSELAHVNLFHESTKEQLTNLSQILASWEAKQSEKKGAYEEFKKTYDNIQDLEKKKINASKIEWMMLYVPLKEIDDAMKKLREPMDAATAKVEEIQNLINNRDEEYKSLETKINKLCKEEHELLQSREKALDKANLNSDAVKEWKRKMGESEERIRKIRRQIDQIDQEEAILRKNLEEKLGSLTDDNFDDQIAEIEKQRANCQRQLDDEAAQREILSLKRKTHYKALQQVENTKREHEYAIEDCKRELNRIQTDEQNFANVRKDQLARFGRQTSQILQLIETNKDRFHEIPIGPVGMHVKVKDAKWTPAIEFSTRRHLNKYICDNSADRQLFERLLRENHIPSVPVATMAFAMRKHNIAPNCPAERYMTIERAIDIEEPTVYNFVVDAMGMESIALMESDNEARREMNQQNPPQNIKCTFTQSCSTVYPVRPEAPYRYYHGYPFQPRILGGYALETDGDFEARREDVRNRINEHRTALEVRNKEVTEAKDRVKEVDEEIAKIDRRCQKHTAQMGEYDNQMKQLEEVSNSRSEIENLKFLLGEVNGRREGFQERITSETERSGEFRKKMDECYEQIRISDAELKEHHKAHELKRDERQVVQKQFVSFKGRVNDMRRDLATAQHVEDKFKGKLARLEAEKAEAEEKLEDRHKFEKPENMDDPPDFSKLSTREFLTNRREKFNHAIRHLKTLIGDQVVTKEEVDKAKKEHDQAMSQVELYKKRRKAVLKSFVERQRLLEQTKKNLPKILRDNFRNFMGFRNYTGDLTFDHEAKTIEIRVLTHQKDTHDREGDDLALLQTVNDSQGGPEASQILDKTSSHTAAATETDKKKKRKVLMQDLKNLSGGERSYTTACFVMALWTCVESPFRCLDEFDVFMDMVNRRIIMELLTDLARQHKHLQFFFFTPQTIAELEAEDVEVFQLAKVRE